MSHEVRERVWIWKFLNKLLSKQAIRRIRMLGDNEISLTLTKDLESQNQTKCIDVMHHYIQRLVEDGELGIKWIPGVLMLTDGLWKLSQQVYLKVIDKNRVWLRLKKKNSKRIEEYKEQKQAESAKDVIEIEKARFVSDYITQIWATIYTVRGV